MTRVRAYASGKSKKPIGATLSLPWGLFSWQKKQNRFKETCPATPELIARGTYPDGPTLIGKNIVQRFGTLPSLNPINLKKRLCKALNRIPQTRLRSLERGSTNFWIRMPRTHWENYSGPDATFSSCWTSLINIVLLIRRPLMISLQPPSL